MMTKSDQEPSHKTCENPSNSIDFLIIFLRCVVNKLGYLLCLSIKPKSARISEIFARRVRKELLSFDRLLYIIRVTSKRCRCKQSACEAKHVFYQLKQHLQVKYNAGGGILKQLYIFYAS